MSPDGSQTNWHYKIIWVGSAGTASSYWVAGGNSVWGNYEVVTDQGMDKTTHQHTVYARGIHERARVARERRRRAQRGRRAAAARSRHDVPAGRGQI